MPRGFVLYCLVLLFGIFTFPSNAQYRKAISRAVIDSLINPPLLPHAGRLIRCDKPIQDLGLIGNTDTIINKSFVCKNISSKDIEITRLHTSCGCTKSTCSDSLIAPGESVTIYIAYNPRNRFGNIEEHIYVYSAFSSKEPIAKLSLKGKIDYSGDKWRHLPYRMGDLRLKRSQVVLKTNGVNTPVVERIWCANSGNSAIIPTSKVRVSYLKVGCEPAYIEPGKEADIIVSLDRALLPSDRRDRLSTLDIEIAGINELGNNKITIIIDDTNNKN